MTKPNHTCGAIPAMICGMLCLIFIALPLVAQSVSRLRLEQSADLRGCLKNAQAAILASMRLVMER